MESLIDDLSHKVGDKHNNEGVNEFNVDEDHVFEMYEGGDFEEQYYPCFHIGRHSSLQILSMESTKWIKQQIPDTHQQLKYPFDNFSVLFSLSHKLFDELWDRPVADDDEREKLNAGIFPDSVIVNHLLKYYDGLFVAKCVCSSRTLNNYFDIFYTRRRRLNFSELLIMNMGLCIVISKIIDNIMKLNNDIESLGMSTQDLINLQAKCFSNSIYYYELTKNSLGLSTVRGILLIVLFLDTSCIKSNMTFPLMSLAIRYAQQMGVHMNLENPTMFKIWWVCEYLDIEISYRLGKSPIINSRDVLLISDEKVKSIMGVTNLDNVDLYDKLMNGMKITRFFGYCSDKLTKLKYKSYDLLFCAQANKIPSIVIKNLKELNNDMEALRNSIVSQLRPKFWYDEGFETTIKDTLEVEQSRIGFSFQLNYFFHLMTINKMATQLETNTISQLKFYRTKTLDSARTILHIMNLIDKSKISFQSLNWTLHYPFSAFLTMISFCMNNVEKVEIDDITLLSDAFTKVFGQQISLDGLILRESSIYVVCGLLFEICLILIESKTQYNFIDDNLRYQFEQSKLIIPELYQDKFNSKAISKSRTNSNTSTSYSSNPGSNPSSNPSSNNDFINFKNSTLLESINFNIWDDDLIDNDLFNDFGFNSKNFFFDNNLGL